MGAALRLARRDLTVAVGVARRRVRRDGPALNEALRAIRSTVAATAASVGRSPRPAATCGGWPASWTARRSRPPAGRSADAAARHVSDVRDRHDGRDRAALLPRSGDRPQTTDAAVTTAAASERAAATTRAVRDR
jgi:hypothetical protein